MPSASTNMSVDAIKAEAKKVALADEDFNALTLTVFDTGAVQITAYPDGNPRARKFFDRLVSRGMAELKRD